MSTTIPSLLHDTAAKPETGLKMEANGPVWEVTLCAPPDNYISASVLQALNEAVDRFEREADLRLMLLQGSKSVFSKGFDLSSLESGASPQELRESLILSNSLFTRIARCRKPTVAAIQGACLGGGLELSLACHFRVCSDRARLGLPEIWIKLVPGLGGVYRLHQLVGRSKTLEMVTLGDLITSEEAYRLNVVNRVFPKADFPASVQSFVHALLMAEGHVLTEAIELVNACNASIEQDNLRLGMEAFARLAKSWSRPQG